MFWNSPTLPATGITEVGVQMAVIHLFSIIWYYWYWYTCIDWEMFGEVKGIIRINASPFSRCVKISAGKWGNYWRPVGSDKSEEKDSWIFQFITSAWGKGSLTLVDSKKHRNLVALIECYLSEVFKQGREEFFTSHDTELLHLCCMVRNLKEMAKFSYI